MRPAPIVLLAKRLRVYRRGLVAEIAEALGITLAAVVQWQEVPPQRVPDVARVMGVRPHQLRPDLWDPPARLRCRR